MNSDMVLYNNLQEARREHEAIKAEYVAYKEECEVIKAGYNKDLAVLEEEKAELERQIEESLALIEEYTEKITALAGVNNPLIGKSLRAKTFMARYMQPLLKMYTKRTQARVSDELERFP